MNKRKRRKILRYGIDCSRMEDCNEYYTCGNYYCNLTSRKIRDYDMCCNCRGFVFNRSVEHGLFRADKHFKHSGL